MNMLMFDKEAKQWEEALPLGNGRIGAMVWSGESLEKLSLNDDTLWSGFDGQDHNIKGAAKEFTVAQKLAMEGKYSQAQEHIEAHTLGSYSESYLPLGDLLLEMPTNKTTDYKRILDIENALSVLTYKQGEVNYKREAFVSATDQALVMQISGDKPGSVSFKASFACQLRYKTSAENSRLKMEGLAPSNARPLYHLTDNPITYDEKNPGLSFIVLADFEALNGEVKAEGESICITGADKVVIRLCCRTNFELKETYRETCKIELEKAIKSDYQSLKARHIEDYQALYKRMEISFGKEANLPLPQRLAKWEQSENDPALFALLFQYGRYLMIAGSRPGTTPLNLQGIWNPHLHPPWSSNYTVNINTEMNYWPAELANLPECHQPLFDFIKRLQKTGAKTAKEHYNAGGFTVHHNSDIWGLSNPVGERGKGRAVYGFWPMAAGWLSAHVFEHYLFTLDKDFLRDTAWPILHDAARFYLDVLVEDEDGTLIFAPSTSPENNFIYEDKACAVSKTATMTTAIIRETLSNVIYCCDVLNSEPPIKQEATKALKRLPAYQIGSRGELLEWSEELPEYEPAHRHTSHLYPLYPGREIEANTALAKACAKTLELRGGEGTGWALAWRINLWARMQESEKAFNCLKKQLRPATDKLGGCYPNLFGAHPPFQIDSNFGACAGIAEMLLQSSIDNVLHLLPALPKALGTGHVVGLRARGGVAVSMFFTAGKLEKAELTLDSHLASGEFTVKYAGKEQLVELVAGEVKVLEFC